MADDPEKSDIEPAGRRPTESTLNEEKETTENINQEVAEESAKVAPGLPAPVHDVEAGGDGDGAAAVPTTSRTSSARIRIPVPVPKSKRRGLLNQVCVIPEVEKPYDYTNRTKWILTTGVAIAGAAAPIGSAIFYPSLPSMAEEFHVTGTIVNLAVAFYMLAMSIFPLWWSSFSETFGRRSIYVISMALNVVFTVLSGLSVNIAMLIVMRILSGGASASVQAVGAGTIADMWEPKERGRAMGLFYLGPLMGPLFAPIIGGALSEAFGWRSTMWFTAVFGGACLLLIVFFLPETLERKKPVVSPEAMRQAEGGSAPLSRVSTTRSVQIKTKATLDWLKKCMLDPLEVLGYLRFPAILIIVYYAAITFGSLYVLNISVQSAFSEAPYSFSPVILGLLYIPASLGYFIASIFGGPWIDRIMIRAAKKAGRYDANGRLIYLPEDRMQENAWLSATLYPGALIWYGWTVQRGVFWLVPCIANFFFGLGSMLVFSAATTMLTEFMPRKSSSGVALNNFVRNIFSCTGGIIAQPLINAMGHGWLFTMVGLLAWLSGNLAIWALRRNAQKWRAEMDKALKK